MTYMQAVEEDIEGRKWESRFVVFGYILLEALEKITEGKTGHEIDIAKEALDKFQERIVGK